MGGVWRCVMLKQVQPVLPVRNIDAAVEFYVGRLGFSLVFKISGEPGYAVIRRDGVELHLQWHDPSEWSLTDRPMLRFLVADVDTLFKELQPKGVFHERTALRATPWHTREFAFYDPDRNGLTFYVDVDPSSSM
jgi:catechol 2,3-dioxygenase-like lactoylglutathione lyase family enzyme